MESYRLCLLWMKTGCNIKDQMFLQYFCLPPRRYKKVHYMLKNMGNGLALKQSVHLHLQ